MVQLLYLNLHQVILFVLTINCFDIFHNSTVLINIVPPCRNKRMLIHNAISYVMSGSSSISIFGFSVEHEFWIPVRCWFTRGKTTGGFITTLRMVVVPEDDGKLKHGSNVVMMIFFASSDLDDLAAYICKYLQQPDHILLCKRFCKHRIALSNMYINSHPIGFQ